MLALSVMQPWAWLLVNNFKDIENRSWPTRLRGKVLIHAGKKIDKDFDWQWATNLINAEIPQPHQLDVGGVVGMVNLKDCVKDSTSPWFFGKFGFVIDKARPLPFMPIKGQLGFFNVDYDKELLS